MWRAVRLTLEHVLDEDAALGDLLIDDELLVIRGNEEDHCGQKRVDGWVVVVVRGRGGAGMGRWRAMQKRPCASQAYIACP